VVTGLCAAWGTNAWAVRRAPNTAPTLTTVLADDEIMIFLL
jgi:hypothetical protein